MRRIARDTLTLQEARQVAILDDHALDLVHELLRPPGTEAPFSFLRAVPNGSTSELRGGPDASKHSSDEFFRKTLKTIFNRYLSLTSPVHDSICEWLINVWAQTLYGPFTQINVTPEGELQLVARNVIPKARQIPGIEDLTMSLHHDSNIADLQIHEDFIDWSPKDIPYAWAGPIRLLKQGCRRCANAHYVLRPINPSVSLPDGANLQCVSASRPIQPGERLWALGGESDCDCAKLPKGSRKVKKEPAPSRPTTPPIVPSKRPRAVDGTPVSKVVQRRKRLPTPTPSPESERGFETAGFELITGSPIPELCPDYVEKAATLRQPNAAAHTPDRTSTPGLADPGHDQLSDLATFKLDPSSSSTRHVGSSPDYATSTPPTLASALRPLPLPLLREPSPFSGPFSSTGLRVNGAPQHDPTSASYLPLPDGVDSSTVATTPDAVSPDLPEASPWLIPREADRSGLVSPSELSADRTTFDENAISPKSATAAKRLLDLAVPAWMAATSGSTPPPDSEDENDAGSSDAPTQLARAQTKMTQQLSQTRFFESRVNTLVEQKTDLERQLRQKEGALQGMDKRLLRQAQDTNETTATLANYHRKLGESQQQTASVEKQLRTLQRKHDVLRAHSGRAEARAKERKDKFEIIKQRYMDMKPEYERLQKDVCAQDQQRKDLVQECDRLKQERDTARQDRNLAIQVREQVQQQLSHVQQERDSRERERDEVIKRRQQDRDELVSRHQRELGYFQQQKELESRQMMERQDRLDADNARLHRENDQLNRENSALLQRLRSSHQRVSPTSERLPPQHTSPVPPPMERLPSVQTAILGRPRSSASSAPPTPLSNLSVPLPGPSTMVAAALGVSSRPSMPDDAPRFYPVEHVPQMTSDQYYLPPNLDNTRTERAPPPPPSDPAPVKQPLAPKPRFWGS